MPTRHPNVEKMTAAVTRWIGEAQARHDGAQALQGRIEWFEKHLTAMGRDRAVPSCFDGLGAFDLSSAIGKLAMARNDMTREAA